MNFQDPGDQVLECYDSMVTFKVEKLTMTMTTTTLTPDSRPLVVPRPISPGSIYSSGTGQWEGAFEAPSLSSQLLGSALFTLPLVLPS